MTLLGSLLAKYSTLVTGLEARNKLTLGYVQQSLLHEEKKLTGEYRSHENSAGGGSTAMYSTEQGQQHRRYKPKCYKCSRTGHLRRDGKKPDGSTKHNAKHNAKPAETNSSDSESDNGVFTASSVITRS